MVSIFLKIFPLSVVGSLEKLFEKKSSQPQISKYTREGAHFLKIPRFRSDRWTRTAEIQDTTETPGTRQPAHLPFEFEQMFRTSGKGVVGIWTIVMIMMTTEEVFNHFKIWMRRARKKEKFMRKWFTMDDGRLCALLKKRKWSVKNSGHIWLWSFARSNIIALLRILYELGRTQHYILNSHSLQPHRAYVSRSLALVIIVHIFFLT